MIKLLASLLLFSIIRACYGAVSLSDDPSLFPGHLKPMGSDRPQGNIVSLDHFPEPEDFFTNYVDKSVPLLIQGGAKSSPAFKLWQDDYLKSHKEAETVEVFVENRKKENRTKGGYNIPLKKFIETYHDTDMYMVNGVPDHLQKDIRMPPPLRCEETRKLLVDTVTWFSSGGTKSVLHNDDVDNINCLFRGNKQLLFISYDKYKTKVTIDRPEGGYSNMDVDALDFVKYPGMREVEYINATMHEGDCLFIPYKWFHQVNSWSNKEEMNVAVNVWFKHQLRHRPKNCKMTPDEATLDKYVFADLERQKQEASEENSPSSNILETLEGLLAKTDNNEMKLEEFVENIKKESKITKVDISAYPTLKSLSNAAKPLFDILDIDRNGKIDTADFDKHEKESTDEIQAEINRQVAAIEDYAEDLFEAIDKGMTAEDFDAGLQTNSKVSNEKEMKDEL